MPLMYTRDELELSMESMSIFLSRTWNTSFPHLNETITPCEVTIIWSASSSHVSCAAYPLFVSNGMLNLRRGAKYIRIFLVDAPRVPARGGDCRQLLAVSGGRSSWLGKVI